MSEGYFSPWGGCLNATAAPADTTSLGRARELMHDAPAAAVQAQHTDTNSAPRLPCFVCRHCGGPMLIVETFVREQTIRAPPAQPHAL